MNFVKNITELQENIKKLELSEGQIRPVRRPINNLW